MKRNLFVICVTLFLLIVTSAVQAQIPRTLSYQGVLTDGSGTPKPDASYNATFRIYDVASGGTALWSETETITTKNGLFSTMLGDQTTFPSSLEFDEQYWLGIQIAPEVELSPRIKLTSVAYSQNSLRADTATVCLNCGTGDGLWTQSGSDIYRLNGKVGIGTTAPTRPFEVVTNSGSEVARFVQSGTTDGDGIWIDVANSNPDEGALNVTSGVGSILSVRNNGNVGIGTTNPQQRLEVSGSINIVDNTPTGHHAFRTAGNWLIGQWASDNTITIGSTEISNDVRFYSNSGNLLTIKSTGNVGIGTTAPSQPLHVVGPVRWQNSSGSVVGELNVDTGADLLSIGNSTGNSPVGNASAALGLYAGGAERIRLDQIGNVGIGTTTPVEKLHVTGENPAIRIGDGAAGTWADLWLMGDSKWLINAHNTSHGLNFRYYDGDWDNIAMVIKEGGNVGMGTTTPGYKLHVIGDIAYTGNIYDVSDRRLKENITPLESAVEKVACIQGIYFNNKGESPDKREVGVIAQDVEEVLPEVVSENAEGFKSVDYTKLTPLLIEAIKEQQKQIEELKAVVNSLSSKQ